MDELEKLQQEIEALKNRMTYFEETLATIADMNKSDEMGQYIAQRQRALAASKLVNAAVGTQKLNVNAQQQVIDQLAAEKAAMDAKIEEVIRASAQNTFTEDDLAEQFTYRDVPGGVEIQGFNGFETEDEFVVPEKINGKSVLIIGKGAFEKMKFKKVSLPKSILYIERLAFWGCENLESINLPDSLRTLGKSSFSFTKLKNIVIPRKIKVIEEEAFYQCDQLKTVILSEETETIGYRAFEEASIEKIVIPKSVKIVKTNAFCRCAVDRVLHICFLGKETELECPSLPSDAVIYCDAGSKVQYQARMMDITARPLSEFKDI